MAKAGKDAVPPPPDFDSPEWDGAEVQQQDMLAEIVDLILTRADAAISENASKHKNREDTVASVLEAALTAIDMLYVAREESAVTSWSLTNASWEAEDQPIPSAQDAWLRAAIPESNMPKANYVLSEFLRSQQAAMSRAGSFRRADSRRTTVNGKGELGRAGASSPSRTNAKNDRQRNQLSPEQQAAEDRLREELEIRRAQLAVAEELAAKDTAERARIAGLTKELKGRDYSYDHKGQVVPLAHFNPEKAPGLQQGADFAITELDSPGAGAAARKGAGMRRGLSMRSSSPPKAAAAQPQAKQQPQQQQQQQAVQQQAPPSRERKLANDFREAPSHSQPNALEVVQPSTGVTLRQGAASKMGPRRQTNPTSMSKQEFARYSAQKQGAVAAQQVAATAAAAPAPSQQRQSRAAASPSPAVAASASPVAPDPAEPGYGDVDAGAADAGATTTSLAASLLGATGSSSAPDYSLLLSGGTHRKAAGALPAKPRTPDTNLALMSDSNWGRATAGGYQAPPSLAVTRPSEKQREIEVGRAQRMPRDRTNTATSSPPLSPTRLAQQAAMSQARA